MNKESASSIFSLATPFKIIISALITTLSGTTYFAIINKIAMYYYSIKNGFRLPAEGSPFITIAISTVTFLTLMGAAVLFLALLTFSYATKKTQLKLENFYDKKIEIHEKAANHKRRLKFYKYLKGSARNSVGIKFIIFMSSFLCLLSLALVHFTLPSPSVSSYIILPFLAILYPVFIGSPFIPHKKTVLSIMTLLFMLISPILLLDLGNYNKILYSINYGGYSPVALHIGNKTIDNAELVFISSEAIFIRSRNQNKISEVPIKEVSSIDYIQKHQEGSSCFINN